MPKTETAITPLPWRLRSQALINRPYLVLARTDAVVAEITWDRMAMDDSGEPDANAAYIVHACNLAI